MTKPIDTTKHSRDMSDGEKRAFLAQARKLESASSQPKPADTRSAKEMSETERKQWLSEHSRRHR
jgi:hypothetical protein